MSDSHGTRWMKKYLDQKFLRDLFFNEKLYVHCVNSIGLGIRLPEL